MPTIRPIKRIITGTETEDGAGVRLTRVVGQGDTHDFDPFLMLDAFDSTNPDEYTRGFPWHPHRGIETITYLIAGDIEHGDSLGNKGSIKDGDCQWMTAGSGIIHQEMPVARERLFGAQIWLNLPAKYKMVMPKYGDIRHENIPVVDENGSTVHVVAGAYKGTKGAFIGEYVAATYLDVTLLANALWQIDIPPEMTAFAYIFTGGAKFSDSEALISAKHAVLFDEGDVIHVSAGATGVRFILLFAMPLHEPIAWGGPIVMNTSSELSQSFRELDEGTFLAHNTLVD